MKDNNKQLKIILSKKIRWSILLMFSLIYTFLGISGGVFSSSISIIKDNLQISDNQFGSFESICSIGTLIGTFIFTFINNLINRKLYFILSMIITSSSFLFFFITKNYYILLLSRFLNGIGDSFPICYFPIWVEQFGIQKYKTIMFTTIHFAGNLGMIWGYIIDIIIGSKNWKYGLLSESIFIIFITLILIFFPEKYYQKNIFFLTHKNEKNNEKESIISIFIENKNDKKEKENNFSNKHSLFNDVICNLTFICIVIFRSNVYFICIAQFLWFTDYIETSLLIKNKTQIFTSFSISLVFSGMLGSILGGFIGTLIGGYHNENIIKTMIICKLISCLNAISCSLTYNLFYFTLYNTLLNIFDTISGVLASGFVLTIVPKDIIGNANGFFMLMMNFLAFLPSPFIYGFVKSYFKSSKIAFKLLMYYSLIGEIALIIAEIKRRIGKNNMNRNEKEILLQDKNEDLN